MAESDTQRRFSEQLCRVLKMDGVRQSRLKTLRSWICVFEVTRKHLLRQNFLFTGSIIEGSHTVGSDTDQMLIMPDIIAVRGQEEIKAHTGYVFLLETGGVRSGYTKLVLMKTGHANNIPEATCKAVEESLLKEENSKSYFSSDKYKYFILRLFKNAENLPSTGTPKFVLHCNGPCISGSHGNNASLGIEASEFDNALGIQCAEWPLEAEEWFQRRREKGWPSDDMIKAIRMLPCYILPVGDPKSKTQHLEWRFAFVPSERELVWSFNDCQIQCYTILKYLKRNYLNAVVSDELNSFCLKTIVLWISEEQGMEMWTSSNLLECIRLCLIRLQESIDSTFLPHYFVRKRNLLFAKFEDQEVKQNTIGKISEIIERLIPFILECHAISNSRMEDYSRQWFLCQKDLLTFLDTNQKLLPRDPFYVILVQSIDYFRKCTEVIQSLVHFQTTSFQTLLKTVEAIDKLPSDINRHLVESTRSFLKLRLGMSKLAENCLSTNESMKAELISSAFIYFKDGMFMDRMCGDLYMSTFYFITGSRENAEIILRKIVLRMMVPFGCEKAYHNEKGRGNQEEVIDNYIKITKSNHSFRMIFTSTDVSCVPYGLQYECALLNKMNWNYCLINPVVYAQYLRFEIAHSSKNPTECEEALIYLSNVVKNVEAPLPLDEFRALNLLGLCYSKSGRRSQAIECFVRSLGKTPTVWNAACYHLCVIVYRFLDECGKI